MTQNKFKDKAGNELYDYNLYYDENRVLPIIDQGVISTELLKLCRVGYESRDPEGNINKISVTYLADKLRAEITDPSRTVGFVHRTQLEVENQVQQTKIAVHRIEDYFNSFKELSAPLRRSS